MNYYFISDIHIKEPNDFGIQLLKKFFNDLDAKTGDEVFLVGDIFDLMVGYHTEYFSMYLDFFEGVQKLTEKGVVVHYFEGNHDFHLRKMFRSYCKLKNIPFDLFRLHQGIYFTKIGDKKVHVSHGDDIEINNPSYKIYKKIVNNLLMRFVANYIMPFSLLNFIGMRASAKSRERNHRRYEIKDDKNVKEKFRESFRQEVLKRPVDILVCGHSHVKDDYEHEKRRYLNVGYARLEKSYLKISEDGHHQFIALI